MTTPIDPRARVTLRALGVWGVAVLTYVVAVFARTSLSATGVDAAVRFDASPTVLSLFTVLQLAVYAAMQVPAGTVLDRLGARRCLTIGSGLIALGLIVIAFAHTVPIAITARVLIGTGDAFIFISAIRLVPSWFPPRTVPLLTQLTGMAGQLGQMLSLGPLVGLIVWQGWTAAFVAAGAMTLLIGLLALLIVRDGTTRVVIQLDPGAANEANVSAAATATAPAEAGAVSRFAIPLRSRFAPLLKTWRDPGTRAGFWTHFTAPFSAYAFTLLWGFPYMTSAENVPEETALAVLTSYVVGCLVFGPLLGVLGTRFPARRSQIVIGLVGAQILTWALVLTRPGGPSSTALFVLAVVLSSGGPASLIGFDLSRLTNPPRRLGIATGMVNTGGFISTLTCVFLVGLVLEIQGQSTPEQFTDRGFLIAWLIQIPLWVLGLTMMVRSARVLRRARVSSEQ